MINHQKYFSSWVFALTVLTVALAGPIPTSADPLLGSDLASFAVLGSSTVTNVPTSTVVGSVGVWSSGGANAITGFNPCVAPCTVGDPQVTSGVVDRGTATAQSAQGQLTTAITSLSALAGTATQLASSELAGLTLNPGVYSFSTLAGGFATLTGTSAIPGVLTLDGLGNANAAWVFLMDSTLTTSAATAGTAPSSVVNVINTGSGAGLYWNVGSSATIGTYSTFQGNILAVASVTLNTGATDGCGRALANTGAVTMDMNTIGIGCDATTGGEGSNGFSGGLTVPEGGGTPTILPFAPVAAVPEPSSVLLLSTGFVGLALAVRRRKQTTTHLSSPINDLSTPDVLKVTPY